MTERNSGRASRFPIRTPDQLAAALQHGLRLIKTCSRHGPLFEVSGRLVDPATARDAIARGHVRPVDEGLFGPADAQSWELDQWRGL